MYFHRIPGIIISHGKMEQNNHWPLNNTKNKRAKNKNRIMCLAYAMRWMRYDTNNVPETGQLICIMRLWQGNRKWSYFFFLSTFEITIILIKIKLKFFIFRKEVFNFLELID